MQEIDRRKKSDIGFESGQRLPTAEEYSNWLKINFRASPASVALDKAELKFSDNEKAYLCRELALAEKRWQADPEKTALVYSFAELKSACDSGKVRGKDVLDLWGSVRCDFRADGQDEQLRVSLIARLQGALDLVRYFELRDGGV